MCLQHTPVNNKCINEGCQLVEREFIGFVTKKKKNKENIKRTYLIVDTLMYRLSPEKQAAQSCRGHTSHRCGMPGNKYEKA